MIFFDLSTLARWRGAPAGIVRVQQRLARFARAHRPDVVFTLFDPETLTWRMIRPEWVSRIIDREATVDMSLLPDPTRRRIRLQDRLPGPLREGFYWVTRSRRQALTLLERRRLRTGDPATKQRLEHAIDRLAGDKHRQWLRAADGTRIAAPQPAAVMADAVLPDRDDTVFTVQTEWRHANIGVTGTAKRRRGFSYVVFCHDLIPIRHPEWVEADEAGAFRAYYEKAVGIADRFLVPSRNVGDDLARYALGRGMAAPDIRVTPLGADLQCGEAADGALPDGLDDRRYVLYVSTIEPRKNHTMLVGAWKRLADDGTVARHRFRLVLVGRKGHRAGDIHAALKDAAGTVLVLDQAPDDVLRALYRSAAICVYPSLSEGFGLPVAEALAFGRPVLASSASSIPEVAGDRAILLDPLDEAAWAEGMRMWIENPEAREAFAAEARRRYRPLDWETAADAIFRVAVASTAAAGPGVREMSR